MEGSQVVPFSGVQAVEMGHSATMNRSLCFLLLRERGRVSWDEAGPVVMLVAEEEDGEPVEVQVKDVSPTLELVVVVLAQEDTFDMNPLVVTFDSELLSLSLQGDEVPWDIEGVAMCAAVRDTEASGGDSGSQCLS